MYQNFIKIDGDLLELCAYAPGKTTFLQYLAHWTRFLSTSVEWTYTANRKTLFYGGICRWISFTLWSGIEMLHNSVDLLRPFDYTCLKILINQERNRNSYLITYE